MINKKNVIKGLQCIIDGTVRCESCGYAIDKHGHPSCQQNCASDAIALLKEQEAVKIAVKKITESGRCGRCPNCNNELNETDYPNYCGFCGKAVKWR